MREISLQTRQELALIAKNLKQIKWLEGIQENSAEAPANFDAIILLINALTVRINAGEIELAFVNQAAEIAELRKDVEDLKRQIAMGAA